MTFSASPADIRRHAPRFGEHGEAVARELGYDEASIADLLASGALIPPAWEWRRGVVTIDALRASSPRVCLPSPERPALGPGRPFLAEPCRRQ